MRSCSDGSHNGDSAMACTQMGAQAGHGLTPPRQQLQPAPHDDDTARYGPRPRRQLRASKNEAPPKRFGVKSIRELGSSLFNRRYDRVRSVLVAYACGMARIASTGLAALLLATAWCGVCVCTPKWGDDLVWTKGTRALDEDVVTATLGLRHCNLQDLRTVVERVSSPSSHEYGNHLSIQQLRDILECKHGERPVDVVRAWIARHTALADRRLDAAMRVQPSGDWVTLSLPSHDAEALFGVNFFRYRAQAKAKASARRQGRTLRRVSHGVWADTMVRVPSPIAHVVDVVLGVSPSPRSQHAYHIHTDDPAPSRATRPHGATASPTSTTTTSNAPNLMGVLSSDTTMYLQFMPQCLDGSPAMSDLCATSSPPAITGFTVRQTVNGTTTSHVMQTCGGNSLSHAHSMDASSGAVICQNQLATPGPFLLVNITLATEYADGSASASADGGGAIFTTPFVDTSLASIFYGLPKPDASGAPFSVYNQSVVEFSHNFFSFQELDEVCRRVVVRVWSETVRVVYIRCQLTVCALRCAAQFFSFNNLNTDVSVGVVGPNDGSSPEGEANQDVQWIMGIGQRVDTVFWSTKNVNGFILDWLEAVASTPNNVVPRVFSISYGNPEGLTNKQYGDNYIQVRVRSDTFRAAVCHVCVTGALSAPYTRCAWPLFMCGVSQRGEIEFMKVRACVE